MSAGHSHAIPENKKETTLWVALILTSTFLVAEAAAGFLLNSLALLADAAHMFTDAAALAIALAAVRIARRPADARRTYGYHRFEILAAAFNALLLFGVAIYILYEAYQRFQNPGEVQTTGMLVVATIGLVINLISMRLLSAGKDTSLNIKGAYLEVWSDMLGSLGVIVAAVVIRYTGWTWVDTLVAAGIGLWVLPRTWILLKESLNILLEGTPEGLSLDDVTAAMLGVAGVTEVHDLHVWVLTSGKNSLTAHVVHRSDVAPAQIIENIQALVAKRFEVFHTTIQCELVACEHSADGCNFIERRPSTTEIPESHSTHVH
ncbi:MAG: cation diffusion facilitator family transporter [Polaromonas sp.]|uniref:cation diffusion facilitator family transporter n=1 Tax=Polaromonas sp. TaxID=1869339 RepID=UPI00248831A1|nr:cation diffusion facilitator family transporter [Polaromonas sp.]MDI1237249.1 cation diffusion facilitator family transporter [Polaromonas sp.]MDO8776812.1 cation diffusion facilitator family transporter [Burkholderiaceae bacterium]